MKRKAKVSKIKAIIGRPPKLFDSNKCVELGKDLIEWLDNDGKEEFMWVRWYWHKHGMTRTEWIDLIQRQYFRTYYEIARKVISSNMVKNKGIRESFANRYLAMYDDELRADEESIRDKEAERKKVDAGTFMGLNEHLEGLGKFFANVRPQQSPPNQEMSDKQNKDKEATNNEKSD